MTTIRAVGYLVCLWYVVAFQHRFVRHCVFDKSMAKHMLEHFNTIEKPKSNVITTRFLMSTGNSDGEDAKEVELPIKGRASDYVIISGSDSAASNTDEPSEQDKMQMGRQGGDDAMNNLSEVVGQSIMDQSIAMAVNQLINDVEEREKPGFKKDNGDVVLSPVEKFRMMYEEIKKDQGTAFSTMDTKKDSVRKDKPLEGMKSHEVKEEAYQAKAANMLEGLFGGEQSKDPFDERKVMMKLKQMLDIEDFKGLFVDPKIGDYL
jgi:hypothetical protein